jgi:methyl-accepting chemotaxis protein
MNRREQYILPMNRAENMKSLQTKILSFFITLILLAGGILSYVLYQSSVNLVVTSISTQAKKIAESTGRQLDVEDFHKIVEQVMQNPADDSNRQRVMDMTEYEEMRKKLAALKEMNGLKYLYTMAEQSPGKYMYIVDGVPLEQTEDVSLPGEVEENEFEAMTAIFLTGQPQIGELSYSEEYGATITAYVPLRDANGKMVGIIGADFDATDIYTLLKQEKLRTLVVIGVSLLAAVLLSVLFARILSKPLRTLTRVVKQVREGDLTVHVPATGRDEVGQLGQAFADMVQELNGMIVGIRGSSKQLAGSAIDLEHAVHSAATRSEQIVEKVEALKIGADEQVAIVHQARETMETMSQEVDNIANWVTSVWEMTESASHLADRGQTQISEAVRQMTAIQEAQGEAARQIALLEQRSQEISEIVVAIAGIARQTNLLALNAAIESARAGELGRGFGVVADEVRKLAEESAQAAGHIASIIHKVQSTTQLAVEKMGRATEQTNSGAGVVSRSGEAFGAILQAFRSVKEQFEGITRATQQLADGSHEMVQSIHGVERIAHRSTEATTAFSELLNEQQAVMEEVSASTDDLTAMVQQLDGLIQRFTIDTEEVHHHPSLAVGRKADEKNHEQAKPFLPYT